MATLTDGSTTERDTPVNNNIVDNSTTDTGTQETGIVNNLTPAADTDNAGSAPADAVTGTAPINNSSIENMDPSDVVEDGKSVGSGKGLDFNTVKNKGVVFPIIRINDHICSEEEIREFYIETGYFKNYHEY